MTFVSASGPHGFSCGQGGGVVTCSSGSIAAFGNATITILVNAPSLAAGGSNVTLTDTAHLSPGNETASVQTTVTAPPAMPDLAVSSFSGSSSVAKGGQATYTVTISNIGSGTANGVNVLIDGGTSDFTITSTTGSSGFAPCYSAPERFSLRGWRPGWGWGPSLAPGASLTVSIVVQVPSTYTGTWSFGASVNPYHNVTESNYNNNSSGVVWTTVF